VATEKLHRVPDCQNLSCVKCPRSDISDFTEDLLFSLVVISIGFQYDMKREEFRQHVRSLAKLPDVCLTAKLFSWTKMSELHRMAHEFQAETGYVNVHKL
jgi:hypothetical protein